MAKNVDYKKLKGEELFFYMTNDYSDEEYRSVVALLSYAVDDYKKALSILEDAVKNDKTFVAIYPAFDEEPGKDMTFIGAIPDGELYLKK